MKYDYLIVWAWLTWLVLWERLTTQSWKKVLIIDRRGKKFRGKVEFKPYLNLENSIDKKENNNIFNPNYKLIGVCTHSGNSSASGHYTACCLADDGNYYYFSDTLVEKVKLEKIYEDEPYLLFYRRLEMTPK